PRRVPKVAFPEVVVVRVNDAVSNAVSNGAGSYMLTKVIAPDGVIGGIHDAIAVVIACDADGRRRKGQAAERLVGSSGNDRCTEGTRQIRVVAAGVGKPVDGSSICCVDRDGRSVDRGGERFRTGQHDGTVRGPTNHRIVSIHVAMSTARTRHLRILV